MRGLLRYLAGFAAVALLLLAAAPAHAVIVYDHGLDLWAMEDDGSGQRVFLPAAAVSGMVDLSAPALDPSGTTLAFSAEWAGWSHEWSRWVPPAPGACGVNCEGVYTLSGTTVTRLSGAPMSCPLNPCGSFDASPAIAPDRDVLFTYTFYNEPGLCGIGYWCIDLEKAALQHFAPGVARTDIPTACSTPGGTEGGDPDHVAVNPAKPQQIAYEGCMPNSANWAVTLAGRDGSSPAKTVFDDGPFESVAFSLDGTHLITSESGTKPGLWRYVVNPLTPTQVLTAPANVTFDSAREISGHRIAFVAAKDVWAIPDSCTAATCSFPASATQLTTDGQAGALAWTGQVLPSPTAPTTGPSGNQGTGSSGDQQKSTTPQVPTPPAMTSLKLSARTLRPANSGPSVTTRGKGLTISYVASQAGTTTFVVSRASSGRRKGRACVKPTRALRRAKRCTRYTTAGSFTHRDTPGPNSVTFTGRLRGRALTRGTYRIVATPRNASGTVGTPVTVTFRVV